MNIKSKTKKALPYTLALSIFRMLVALFGMVLLVRYLEGFEYGILALFTGLPMMINLFSSFGYNIYITRFIPALEDEQEVGDIFWNILFRRLLMALAISLILVFTFPFFASSFDLSDYYNHFVIYQLAVCSQIGSLYITIVLNARYLQKYELILTIMYEAFRVFFIYIGILLGKEFMFFIIVFSVVNASKLLLGTIFFAFLYGFPDLFKMIRFRKQTKEEKSYRRISYVNEIGAKVLDTGIDRYILAYFSQNIQVAIYAIATNILRRILNFMPLDMFRRLLEPTFYAKYDESGKSSDLNKMFQLIFNANNIFGFFYLAIFIPLGKDLLQLVFNRDYIIDVYWPLIVFLSLLPIYFIPLGMFAMAIKKPKILIISKISIILNIALGIPLAYKFGALGMAIATASSVALKNIIIYQLAIKYIQISIPWKSVFKSIFNALITMIVVFFLNEYLAIHILFGVLIGSIVYLIMVKLNLAFNKQQTNLLLSLVPTKTYKLVNFFM